MSSDRLNGFHGIFKKEEVTHSCFLSISLLGGFSLWCLFAFATYRIWQSMANDKWSWSFNQADKHISKVCERAFSDKQPQREQLSHSPLKQEPQTSFHGDYVESVMTDVSDGDSVHIKTTVCWVVFQYVCVGCL